MTYPINSSRDISKINFDIATIYGVKISLVAELRRKLKHLLFELDQSSPLTEEICKKLITEVLLQHQTTNEQRKKKISSFQLPVNHDNIEKPVP